MPTKKPRTGSTHEERYDVHPSVHMIQNWIKELKDKTGRSLPEWKRYIKKNGPGDVMSTRAWLKMKLGLPTNTAWWLSERAFGHGEGEDTPESYLKAAACHVADMYAGPKAGLRPLHDELVALVRSLGRDVAVCPCKTIVPFYRSHVFAQIKPSTRTRIDFGVALGPLMKAAKEKIPARLIETGGFQKKDRITHRIEIMGAADIDGFVRQWAGRAYDLDSPADVEPRAVRSNQRRNSLTRRTG